MRWFRANRQWGGRLALFALAVQLVLSFGHIHREDIYGYAPPAQPAATQQAANDHQPVPPAQPSNHGDDYCAICATIALLSSSLVAAAPQLPLPIVSRAIEHSDIVVAAFSPLYRPQFRSRAPPVA
jgi:hypothetical protein